MLSLGWTFVACCEDNDDPNINYIAANSVANVWHANYGYQFFNQTISDANELGAAFSGRIDEAGNLSASFTISQKVGRKNVEFRYEFRGKK